MLKSTKPEVEVGGSEEFKAKAELTHSLLIWFKPHKGDWNSKKHILALGWKLPVSLCNSGHQQCPPDHQKPPPSSPYSGHCSVLSSLHLLFFTYCIWASSGEHSSLCTINFFLTKVLVNGCLAGSLSRCPCLLHTLLSVFAQPGSSACWSLGQLVNQTLGETGRSTLQSRGSWTKGSLSRLVCWPAMSSLVHQLGSQSLHWCINHSTGLTITWLFYQSVSQSLH